MRKWIKRAAGVILVLATVLAAAAFWSGTDKQFLTTHLKTEGVVPVRENWPGNPVDQKGRFINDEFPFLPKITDLLKWKAGGNRFKKEKQDDKQRLDVKDPREFLASDRNGLIWLGHASFLIRLNGISILTDPVFGDPPFVTRFVHVPSPLEQIRNVDYILLSHDHRDHTDEATIRSITERFPKAALVAGLRSEDILNEWKTPSNPVITAGWFESAKTFHEQVRFYFLPVRHWSRRGLTDTNYRLWGGWIIQSDTATIYFGGDSGYGRHYREAGELFPEIDYFLIGIGAYEPRWFMEPNHNTPAEALRAFQDSGAAALVPMHYGTFDLTDEPPSQPLKLLLEEAENAGLREHVRPLAINESIDIQ